MLMASSLASWRLYGKLRRFTKHEGDNTRIHSRVPTSKQACATCVHIFVSVHVRARVHVHARVHVLVHLHFRISFAAI